MNFTAKLNRAISTNNSLLIVGLDPNPEMMPQEYQQQDLTAGIEAWLLWVIKSTSDRVCAYKPTLGFYQALGIPGLQLLERILAAIPNSIPTILDVKHSDLNTSTVFAKTIFEQWQVDAVTLTPYAGQDHAAPFLVYADRAVFILAHTSNPKAETLQRFPNLEQPYYLQVVKEAQTWATPEQLYLEVGTTNVDILRKIRAIAPERTILLRSLWSKKNNLESLIEIGLNNTGQGLLIPIPQDFLSSSDLSEKVADLNQKLNTYRQAKSPKGLAPGGASDRAASCEIWTPDVCLLTSHPYESLILELFDIGCLLFGEYVQASGATFSYYIDLRKIISNPHIFNQVLDAYGDIVQKLEYDRIAGIPYGALPTATGLALNLQRPMIFPRKEVKAHGTRRLIEGNFEPGEKVVAIDDILISGKSVMEAAEKLKSAGLEVEDIVVFIDHEGGVKQRLADNGYRAHSVLSISEITNTLYEAGKISDEQYASFKKNH